MADNNTPDNPFDSPASDGGYPQMGNGNGNGGNGNGYPPADDEGLRQAGPGVAAKPGKTMLVLGVVGAIVVFLLYTIVFGGKKEVDKKPQEIKVEKREVAIPEPVKVTEIAPPEPPKDLQMPELPQPIDPRTLTNPLGDGGVGGGLEGGININPLTPKEDAAAKAQAMARMKSGIMVTDGSANTSSAGNTTNNNAATPTDPNSQFAAQVAATKVETVRATRIQDLNRTIAQGRIIHATLETAINTDLAAPIRAIVSRDTYGEAGTTPLVPKGSRLIGRYNTTLSSGQTRVLVIWTRIIRPDGVDVTINSPLIDAIGQAGVAGQIDTKFQEIFSRSLLSSVMNIALAIGSEKFSKEEQTTVTTGSTTQSGGAAREATTNALNRLGSVTDGFFQRFLNVPPTILVDQGAVVNVMVNEDLVFPSDTAGGGIVQ